LIEAGIEPKVVSIVRFAGLIIGIFSTSLLSEKKKKKKKSLNMVLSAIANYEDIGLKSLLIATIIAMGVL
jgi:hypothetical protein